MDFLSHTYPCEQGLLTFTANLVIIYLFQQMSSIFYYFAPIFFTADKIIVIFIKHFNAFAV